MKIIITKMKIKINSFMKLKASNKFSNKLNALQEFLNVYFI